MAIRGSLDKLTVAALDNKFPIFYGTGKSVTILTRTRLFSLSWADQSHHQIHTQFL